MAHTVPPIDDWMKATNKFEKNVEDLKKELTNIFRKKWGVKE
ncbi:unnamed protein product [marine sediment metagenome]|uniref:Uncharacterized protein n=1 Tax=marine sediment metagenome TaxID=412755 RepID=X1HEC6_9ZZZZ